MATRVCETQEQKQQRLASLRDRQAKMDTEGARATSTARRGNPAVGR
jgi:hypothetical protein